MLGFLIVLQIYPSILELSYTGKIAVNEEIILRVNLTKIKD